MALVNNGTKVTVVDTKLPTTGYTRPTVTEVAGANVRVQEKTYTVVKTDFEDASAATAFTALVAAINTAAAAEVVVDFDDTAHTITMHTDFKNYINNQEAVKPDTALTTAVETVTATVEVHVLKS